MQETKQRDQKIIEKPWLRMWKACASNLRSTKVLFSRERSLAMNAWESSPSTSEKYIFASHYQSCSATTNYMDVICWRINCCGSRCTWWISRKIMTLEPNTSQMILLVRQPPQNIKEMGMFLTIVGSHELVNSFGTTQHRRRSLYDTWRPLSQMSVLRRRSTVWLRGEMKSRVSSRGR